MSVAFSYVACTCNTPVKLAEQKRSTILLADLLNGLLKSRK